MALIFTYCQSTNSNIGNRKRTSFKRKMIETKYNSNNLQARSGVGGFASPMFASSAYPPEAKRKKNGSFTNNEPISVLDTRSPSPSTSTSTFSSFNTTSLQGNMLVNEPRSAAAGGGGGGMEEWVADPPPSIHNVGLEFGHEVGENANIGLQDWEKLGKQDEILKLLFQGGCLGLAAIDKSSEFTVGSAIAPHVSNVFPSHNTSALGLSRTEFLSNECKGKLGLDSNTLLTNNNNVLACNQEFEISDQKIEVFETLNPGLLSANLKATNANPLLFYTNQEQQSQLLPLVKHQNIGNQTSNLGFPNFKVPFVNSGHQLLPQMLQPPVDLAQRPSALSLYGATSGCREQMGMDNNQQQQELRQFVYDQVYKAAELLQAGNFSNAQGILARLNHVLAPVGKPFLRSAFYVKEALELAFAMPDQIQRIPAPFDGMMKMGSYKVFSEVSPFIQFMNFTCNQVLLEAVDDCEKIHIIDFDIGFGAHWSSFLQEIPCKRRGVTSVKITAFASPSTHHSLEISLMHENLTEFASGLGINFELEVVNVDCFDPNCTSVSSLRSSESEVIVVNFPIWSFASYLSALPSYLCLIERLSPKILVSLSRGCERIDLPLSHHILHTLQYYEALLGSVDAPNMSCDVSNKIERFLFQPRIESTVYGRLLYPNIMPPWRNLFASVGYAPVPISNLAEMQAQHLLNRMQVEGFHVERQEASFSLCWKHWEILSVSAWKC